MEDEPQSQTCPHCFSEIAERATYCPHCCQLIKRAAAAYRLGTVFLAVGLLAGIGAVLLMGETLFVALALVIAGTGALMRILA